MLAALFSFVAPGLSADDPPHYFQAKVVRIADSDTITVLLDKTQRKIRLEGIDAPEKGQAFGTKARRALREKISGKTVRIDWKQRYRYGRIVGRVYLGDRDISLEMVRDGMAWHCKRYSRETALAEAEREARADRRGLWADDKPTLPWEWRKQAKDRKAKARRYRSIR
jgi:endonuclease YncB( thermonuclease family)